MEILYKGITKCYVDYNFNENNINGQVVYNVKYKDTFVQQLHNRKTKYLQLSKQLTILIKILLCTYLV